MHRQVKLPFNYRDAFHVYTIRHRHDGIFWLIDGKLIHELKGSTTRVQYY